MKNLLATLLVIFISWQASGQTITLGVDASCRGFISLNDKRLTKADSMYIIPIAASGGLKIKLSNPLKKALIINIKGVLSDDANSLKLKQEFFTVNGFLSTDDNLILTVNNKSINLKSPFNIEIGCADSAFRKRVRSINFQTVKDPLKAANGLVNTGSPGTNVVLVPVGTTGLTTATTEAEKVYQPGSAVYDALKLTDSRKITDEEFVKIIHYYYPDDSVQNNEDGVKAVKDNPFLKGIIDAGYIGALIPNKKTIDQSSSDASSGFSLSSIGGLDVTKFADGLARFLVKRAKEELSIAFFTKFKGILDKSPDLKTVFPKTYLILCSIGDGIFDYEKYIQNLREAFKDDIQELADHLPGIVGNHTDFFKDHITLAASLKTGCYLAAELQKQVHPGDILANYPMEFLEGETKNVAGSVQMLQLLSASLRDTSAADSTYWVSLKYLRQLVDNKQSFIIYLGLVYQMALSRYDKVTFESGTLVDLLDKTAPEIIKSLDYFKQYKLYILRFAEKTDNLNRMIKSYVKPANDSLAIELYKKYFDGFVDYFQYVAQVGKLPLADKVLFIAALPNELAPYLGLARSVSDLAIDINRKNYSSAINNAVGIYTTIRKIPLQAAADEANKKNAALAKNDSALPAGLAISKPLNDSLGGANDLVSHLITYGGFMATLATAKTSEEVANAIEAAALPSGSARVKRQALFNISLNAYTGLFLGHERIEGIKDKQVFNSFGVTAPVGVALSWGHRFLFWQTGEKSDWSTSLFLSVIDIGAIASYRFKNDTTAQTPTIELKNILSPGAFISIGIPNSPLSVNFGAQTGPNLRKINFNSTLPSDDSSNKIYWRFSASICVDIPLLNLYNHSR